MSVENNDAGRIEEIVCEDRISALPDDLLLKILCLVPPKTAVTTMILSKRWRSLISTLEYKENNDNDDDESLISVWWCLNKSVKRNKALRLAIMWIELGPGCPIHANVEKFVAKSVNHHVILLKFKLRLSAKPTKLPEGTQALTNSYITDYLGDSWSIHNTQCLRDYWSIHNIPNLEDVKIDFDHRYPNIEKMLRYFSSALYLELHLTDEMILCCSKIKFSELRKCKIHPCDSGWMDLIMCFLANTPKLKSFTVDYSSTRRPPIASAAWSEMYSCYPKCLYSSLEKFKVIDYGRRKEEVSDRYNEEQELMKHFLHWTSIPRAKISLSSTLKPETKGVIYAGLVAVRRPIRQYKCIISIICADEPLIYLKI